MAKTDGCLEKTEAWFKKMKAHEEVIETCLEKSKANPEEKEAVAE
jgi:hypothetical protein